MSYTSSQRTEVGVQRQMQFRAVFFILTSTLLMVTNVSFAETRPNALLLDGSFIHFNYDGLNPEVIVRIPFTDTSFRIQGGDEQRFPLGNEYDLRIPFNYKLTKYAELRFSSGIERIYLAQTPTNLLNSGGGVPLNSLGSAHTQQILFVFGLGFSF
jgi:hypothetical protein